MQNQNIDPLFNNVSIVDFIDEVGYKRLAKKNLKTSQTPLKMANGDISFILLYKFWQSKRIYYTCDGSIRYKPPVLAMDLLHLLENTFDRKRISASLNP